MIIWLLTDDNTLFIWLPLKDHQMIMSRLMVIWNGSSVLLWLLCVEYLLITCSFYDYCLLNISWSSVYYPIIIWWLPDGYYLNIIERSSNYHILTIWWWSEDYLMIIWRSTDEHLKIIPSSSEDNHLFVWGLSCVEYLLIICWLWWLSDYYLIITWRSSEDILMNI